MSQWVKQKWKKGPSIPPTCPSACLIVCTHIRWINRINGGSFFGVIYTPHGRRLHYCHLSTLPKILFGEILASEMHCTCRITSSIYLSPDDTGILANQEREAIRCSSAECYVVESADSRGLFQHNGIRNYFRQKGESLPLPKTYTWNACLLITSPISTTL